jgi:GT2 family glycosyltransferase
MPLQTSPLASIIINNYNYARFLGKAIESALAQTYANVEVVIVDDGSTDDSGSVIAQYQDRVIAILKENGGQASALNAGVARSRGDFISFLDADDLLLPDIVSEVVAAFLDHPGTTLVQYRLAVVTGDGAPTGHVRPPLHVRMPSGDQRRNITRLENHTGWAPTSGTAFAASALNRVSPIPEDVFRISADDYLTRAAALCGPIRSLDRVGAYYRMHGENNYLTDTETAARLRRAIQRTSLTHHHLKRLADSLSVAGFPADSRDMVHMTFFAQRLASMRLDLGKHPIPDDHLFSVAGSGIRAALSRADITVTVKLLHLIWFAAVLVAPRPFALWLVERFFYPESRGRFNRVLGKLRLRSTARRDSPRRNWETSSSGL